LHPEHRGCGSERAENRDSSPADSCTGWLCKCAAMTPRDRRSWMPWLRVAVPGAFVGYGAFLVSHSAILGVAAGLVVSVVCWAVLRPVSR
jgi:hypothetical protein